MEKILEIASKLGAAIANNNRYKEFKEAEEQLKKDDEAIEISEELEKQSRKIHGLEKDLKPKKEKITPFFYNIKGDFEYLGWVRNGKPEYKIFPIK